jgi:hypothetical protein
LVLDAKAALTAAAEVEEDAAIEASANGLIEQLGRERDIRLATIERCAQVADDYSDVYQGRLIAARIRALRDEP